MKYFVSHSSDDYEVALNVCSVIEQNNDLACWIAPRNIAVGAFYIDEILKGLDSSDGVIVLLSQSSNQSLHVMREVEYAINLNVPIIVIRIDDFLPSGKMQYLLTSLEAFDYAGSISFEKLSEQVRKSFLISYLKNPSERTIRPFEIMVPLMPEETWPAYNFVMPYGDNAHEWLVEEGEYVEAGQELGINHLQDLKLRSEIDDVDRYKEFRSHKKWTTYPKIISPAPGQITFLNERMNLNYGPYAYAIKPALQYDESFNYHNLYKAISKEDFIKYFESEVFCLNNVYGELRDALAVSRFYHLQHCCDLEEQIQKMREIFDQPSKLTYF